MKNNRKEVSIAKAKSKISQRNNNDEEIPKDDVENLNIYLNDKIQVLKPSKKLDNEKFIHLIETYILYLKNNFNNNYK